MPCSSGTALPQCPPAHRLAALYLVDCMLKTSPPQVYLELLNRILLDVSPGVICCITACCMEAPRSRPQG